MGSVSAAFRLGLCDAELYFPNPNRETAGSDLGEQHFGQLLQDAFDSLPVHVLVLDEFGSVVLTNMAWRRFAELSRFGAGHHGAGMYYPDVYEATAHDSTDLDSIKHGFNAVLKDQVDHFTAEHHWNGPAARGVFRIWIARFQGMDTAHLVVLHEPLNECTQTQERLRQALAQVAELKERLQLEELYLWEESQQSSNFDDMIGDSAALRRVFRRVEQVAPTGSNVLILGETGTGKEMVAGAIHSRSTRQQRPLVKVNCAALPSTLIESEFFGHEKGAFTGALARKIGRFELANGGTIFLDEIGDLALELQAKLLRVLQEGEFERIGSSTTLKVDIRVIAATNRKLEKEVAAGTFRSDLYYRLSVFPIELPPLRERREDIPLLVWYFITKSQRKLGKSITEVPKRTMDALTAYAWPGNVRELENVIERAVILSHSPILRIDEAFTRETPERSGCTSVSTLEDIERAHITGVLEACGGRVKGKSNAAERLGLNPSTLRSRMKKLGIQAPASR